MTSARACPNGCKELPRVLETRSRGPLPDGTEPVYRRRECPDCGHRWNTYELTEEALRALQRQATRRSA